MSLFLISLPHCSPKIADEILPDFALNKNEILESEDFGTYEIFGSLPWMVIKAEFSRLVVDLNRNPDNKSAKGVVAKTDYHGRQIYKPFRYPDEVAISQLVQKYFRPYHEKMEQAFANLEIKFLFDCHSLESTGPKDAPDAGKNRKDIILSNNGDIDGNLSPAKGLVSCPVNILMFIKSAFENYGFSVGINKPYSGGFTTIHYGGKYLNKNALQIEINQGLFMNPGDTAPDNEKIKGIRIKVLNVFKKLSDYFS
ncbi:MAG: N-formylglutamate amidohydrolase [Desulfobacterales bacterium]|nr:N-formylglutamate amidohydrolase [Desulfobacterales bacterium]